MKNNSNNTNTPSDNSISDSPISDSVVRLYALLRHNPRSVKWTVRSHINKEILHQIFDLGNKVDNSVLEFFQPEIYLNPVEQAIFPEKIKHFAPNLKSLVVYSAAPLLCNALMKVEGAEVFTVDCGVDLTCQGIFDQVCEKYSLEQDL